MKPLIDSETATPFNDLLIEMYDNQDNEKALRALRSYVLKYKKDYCIVHLFSLIHTVDGYITQIELKDLGV